VVLYSLGLAVAEEKWERKLGAGFSLFLLRWAEHLERSEVANMSAWIEGAKHGLENLKGTGWRADFLESGLTPVISGLVSDVGEGMDWVVALERAAMSAEARAVGTAKLHGGLADSAAVGTAMADSACHALGVAMRAIYQAVKLETETTQSIPTCESSESNAGHISLDSSDSELKNEGKFDVELSDSVVTYSEISNPDSKQEKKHDAEQSDSHLIHSENEKKIHAELSDVVLIHSEISNTDSKNDENIDVEGSEFLLVHSEISITKSKNEGKLEISNPNQEEKLAKESDSMQIHSEKSNTEEKLNTEGNDSVLSNPESKNEEALYAELRDSVLVHSEISNTERTELKNQGKLNVEAIDSVVTYSEISNPESHQEEKHDAEESDYMMIPSETSNPEAKNVEIRDLDIIDSVIIHSELSHLEAKNEVKCDSEVSDSNPENINPDSKDEKMHETDSALGDSVLMDSQISDHVSKCSDTSDSVSIHPGKSDSRHAKRARHEEENDSAFGEPDLKRPALEDYLPNEEKRDTEASVSVLMHAEISETESKNKGKINAEVGAHESQKEENCSYFVPKPRKPISFYS